MSILAALLDSLYPRHVREGTLSCICGGVQLSIRVPPSSHFLIEQTNALCHCHDCLRFVETLTTTTQPRSDRECRLVENNATHLVQFYKSDVRVAKGQDLIKGIRMKEKSPMIRCFCRRCKTPLGADVDIGPVLLLYVPLIKFPYPMIMAKYVLNFASAVPGTRSYCRDVKVSQGLDPGFLLRVIARVFLGFLFGKGKGGLLQNEYSQIPTGLMALEKEVAR